MLHRLPSAQGPQVVLERAPRLIVWPGSTDTKAVQAEDLAEPAIVEEEAGDEEGEEDFAFTGGPLVANA